MRQPSGSARASAVVLKSGKRIEADTVVQGLGVRPETSLAKNADLELGALGDIRVKEHMQTSDAKIYAVGDAVEVRARMNELSRDHEIIAHCQSGQR